jgi:hypothetical protein
VITKLEVGSTYKLIDKAGYLLCHYRNAKFYKEYFIADCITIEAIVNKAGMVMGCGVIHPLEYEFFEVKNSTTLSEITLPFGVLDNQTKKDLLCAWVDGAEIEIFSNNGWRNITMPSWAIGCTYRVKPTISAKENAKAIAKAKLISEAQQQLRSAQEVLDKLQKL